MKKIMFWIKSFTLIIFLSKIAACNFAPGSYPYAEKYEISADESTLVSAIQNFKKNNPQYDVPDQTELRDGRNDTKDHWYYIYFYYPNENQILYCWTRSAEQGKTIFAFVSINQGLTLGNWKEINKDFNNTENKEQKRRFEGRILNKLKEKLQMK